MRTAKATLDARLKTLLAEKTEATKNAQEAEDQLETLLRDYNHQLTKAESHTLTTKSHTELITELEAEKQRLGAALAEAESQNAYLRANYVESSRVGQLEASIADLQSRVDFERRQKQIHETTASKQQDELERLEDRLTELQRTSTRAADAIALHRKERLADAERFANLKKCHDETEHRYKRAVSHDDDQIGC